MNTTLIKSFSAVLARSPAKGGRTYVIWPGSAEYFRPRGLVKVTGTVDGEPFHGSFLALGERRHKLAFAADVRDRIGKQAGDVVVTLTERIAG